MLKTLVYILENYGLGVVNLALLIILAWKFATNHLKHIQDQLTEIKKEVKGINCTVGNLQQRVSKIEGQIEK